MNKNDGFDDFLKVSFQRGENIIEDMGFTKKVISNLPSTNQSSLMRNLILFLTSLISISIFFISGGYKSIIISMFDNFEFQNMGHFAPFFLLISIFISVFIFIASIEYDKNTI